MLGLSTYKSWYTIRKNTLKNNLARVYNCYSGDLSGDEADALVALVQTGNAMLDEMDLIYCDSFGSFKSPDPETLRSLSAIYSQANCVLDLFLKARETNNLLRLQSELNRFNSLVNLTVKPASFGSRALAAISAFKFALIACVGLVAAVVFPPFAMLTGVGVPGMLAVAGTGVACLLFGGVGAVREVKIVQDRGYKSLHGFKHSVGLFKEKICAFADKPDGLIKRRPMSIGHVPGMEPLRELRYR